MGEIKYEQAGLTVKELETELDELWAELKHPDSDVSKEAKARGIAVGEVATLERKEAIALKMDDSAFADGVTLIVTLAPLATALVPAATPIIKDLWFNVLRPRILQKKGEHVLQEKGDTAP